MNSVILVLHSVCLSLHSTGWPLLVSAKRERKRQTERERERHPPIQLSLPPHWQSSFLELQNTTPNKPIWPQTKETHLHTPGEKASLCHLLPSWKIVCLQLWREGAKCLGEEGGETEEGGEGRAFFPPPQHLPTCQDLDWLNLSRRPKETLEQIYGGGVVWVGGPLREARKNLSGCKSGIVIS